MRSTPMMAAPIRVPTTVPTPPPMLEPPMMTEAMASISKPLPAVGWATPTLEALMMPAKAAQTPASTKQRIFRRLVLTPEMRVASSLPPMAKMRRPVLVMLRNTANTRAKSTMK